jgi:hypothetical protein
MNDEERCSKANHGNIPRYNPKFSNSHSSSSSSTDDGSPSSLHSGSSGTLNRLSTLVGMIVEPLDPDPEPSPFCVAPYDMVGKGSVESIRGDAISRRGFRRSFWSSMFDWRCRIHLFQGAMSSHAHGNGTNAGKIRDQSLSGRWKVRMYRIHHHHAPTYTIGP